MAKKIFIFLITIFLTVFAFLIFNFKRSALANPQWIVGIVDSEWAGLYTSIHAVDADTVFIGYYGGGDLKFAKSIDGGSNWTNRIVDSAGDTGWYASIHAVDADTIFISYYTHLILQFLQFLHCNFHL